MKKRNLLLAGLSILTMGVSVFATPVVGEVEARNDILNNTNSIIRENDVFVSLDLLTQLFGMKIDNTEHGVILNMAHHPMIPMPDFAEMPVADLAPLPEDAVAIERATIISIDLELKQMVILPAGLEDAPQNYIALNITEETILTNGLATLEDFEVGGIVTVQHSMAMTKSMVPQANAYLINAKIDGHSLPIESEIPAPTVYEYDENGKMIPQVNHTESLQSQTFTVENAPIVEVLTNADNMSIIVGSLDNPMEQTIFHISEDTIITTSTGEVYNKEDLANNQIVTVIYGPIMTLSIPAQTTALEIIVNQ
ncbi:MAG: hypothetical protein BEN19_03545 [Epulopiscium sp. Nuni2H_MBin003]|nr:MAG: hypothetical protein BEN19_03545 [Epulopiscium sp. Nuni2H_MBin003]